jgi:uncharacterized repeat protein (TIGR02543 family)
MKKVPLLMLALVLALTLAACDGGNATGTTPTANNNPTNTPAGNTPSGNDNANTPATETPSGNDSTNAPAINTASGGNDTQQYTAFLTLQIIDSRNGVLRLHDPDLQESYPIPNPDIDHLDSLYQWNVSFGNDNNDWSIIATMNNISEPSPLKANIRTHIDYEPNTFPVNFDISGKNLYYQFSIPAEYDFDLNTITYVGYRIINRINNVDMSNRLMPNDVIVTDIGSDFTPTTPDTSTPDGGNNTPAPSGPFTVTIISNGGMVSLDGITSLETIVHTAASGSIIPEPAVYKIKGYRDGEHEEYSAFGGWFTDAALTIPYKFMTEITSDLTLYAKWLD